MRIVLATVAVSALVTMVGTRLAPPSPVPGAAQSLGDRGEELGSFRLTERSGRVVTEADLGGRVSIVSFIFTRCPLSCPRISSVMKSLQDTLAGSNVLLISLSVDPDHDTPQVLSDYARRFGADADRWWFLTGSRSRIYELIQNRFKLSVLENPAPDPEGKSEAISHSSRLALVEHGRVVGLFDSNEASSLRTLIAQAKRMASPAWIRGLPVINASLNALCATFLIIGWGFIRRRVRSSGLREPALEHTARDRVASGLRSPEARGHAFCMISAVVMSSVFLACYLVYHFYAGSVAFRGQGPARWLYLTILLSHTLLATFGVVPLVLITLLRALQGDFRRHAAIAAVTFPIWLYVSVTGVLIYLMLYHLPTSTIAPLPIA